MTSFVTAQTLKAWLHDGAEIALFDVREHGQYGEAHLFYAVPLPYSRLEIDVPRLAPRRAVRMVVYDDNDGVAARAAESGYGTVEEYLESLVRADAESQDFGAPEQLHVENAAELESLLLKRLNDDRPSIEATPQFWEDFRRRVTERRQAGGSR